MIHKNLHRQLDKDGKTRTSQTGRGVALICFGGVEVLAPPVAPLVLLIITIRWYLECSYYYNTC